MKDNMQTKKKKLKVKHTASTEQVIGYLEQMLHNLKQGQLSVEHGDQNIELSVNGFAEFEFEFEEKDGKRELSFELCWKDGLQSEQEDVSLTFGPGKFEQGGTTAGHGPECNCNDCCVMPSGNILFEPHHMPEVVVQAGCGVLPPFSKVENAREVMVGKRDRLGSSKKTPEETYDHDQLEQTAKSKGETEDHLAQFSTEPNKSMDETENRQPV